MTLQGLWRLQTLCSRVGFTYLGTMRIRSTRKVAERAAKLMRDFNKTSAGS